MKDDLDMLANAALRLKTEFHSGFLEVTPTAFQLRATVGERHQECFVPIDAFKQSNINLLDLEIDKMKQMFGLMKKWPAQPKGAG